MTPDNPRIAICPGTYDPPTRGHLDIIRRATRIADQVIVSVVRNPSHKDPMFSADERVALLEEGCSELDNVTVAVFTSLVVEHAHDLGATIIVKGLRAVSDFEWEFQMGHLNAGIAPDVETVFLMSDPRYSFVSSSGVREIARHGGDVSQWLTPSVAAELNRRIRQGHDAPEGA